MYLVVEDAGGATATVMYDGPQTDITIEDWQQWRVTVDQLAGVDLTAVQKLTLGVGDPAGASVSSSGGYLYYDDIRLYPSICLPDQAPAGDLNDDCVVNLEDFSLMSAEWMLSSYTLEGEAPDDSKLLLWYKFDETADANVAADSSGNGHDGTFSFGGGLVNPVWDIGYDGGALSLDDDTAVIAPNDVFPGGLNDLTISVWVAGGIGTVGRDNTVLEVGATGEQFLRIDIPDDQGGVTWKVGDANNVVAWAEARSAEWLDLWNHYAFIKDSSGMRIYANGRLVVDQAGIGQALAGHLTNVTFKIGAQLSHNNDFIGKIDNLKIYSYALSDKEVVGAASGGTDLYVPVRGLANLHQDEDINFMDLSAMLTDWLTEELWP